MRRWHRVCAPIFALLLLAVALTGFATRIIQTIDQAPVAAHKPVPKAGKAAACTPNRDRPQRTPLGDLGHAIKAIHSGESLGQVGVALSLLSGLALSFFAGSGLWMYCQMWLRRRRARSH